MIIQNVLAVVNIRGLLIVVIILYYFICVLYDNCTECYLLIWLPNLKGIFYEMKDWLFFFFSFFDYVSPYPHLRWKKKEERKGERKKAFTFYAENVVGALDLHHSHDDLRPSLKNRVMFP